jgi:hypothetical protein
MAAEVGHKLICQMMDKSEGIMDRQTRIKVNDMAIKVFLLLSSEIWFCYVVIKIF